jgi:hypothetical protein
LLALAVSSCKVSFKSIPSLLYKKSFIPMEASNVKGSSGKDFGLRSLEILGLTDVDPSCLCVINTVLDLLE